MSGAVKVFPSQHFHVEPCYGTEEQNDKYCKKSDTQVGEFEFYGVMSAQGKSDITKLEADVKAGLSKKDLWDNHFPLMSTRAANIERAMVALNPPNTEALYSIDRFPDWEPITDWTKTIVLAGEAGIGKTEFAIANIRNPLLCKDINDLRAFDPTVHGGIVFDDMDDWVHNTSREIQIQILEQARPSSIRVLWGTANIPRKTKKIFTTNNVETSMFAAHAATERRHRRILLEKFSFDDQPENQPGMWGGAVVNDLLDGDLEADDRKEKEQELRLQVDGRNQILSGDLDTEEEEAHPALVRADAMVWHPMSSADVPNIPSGTSRKRARSPSTDPLTPTTSDDEEEEQESPDHQGQDVDQGDGPDSRFEELDQAMEAELYEQVRDIQRDANVDSEMFTPNLSRFREG